ncbi:right-handed parallel beta-helix repeat-containing protein [Catenovulum maritimum]|uniref:right-handed parallel beta-helix repeat-containing protein n=1 Tax=Catenovulum maritimum TaxID=1513271 RepID=UPI0006617748|nr:right-handed parallel beta-helix repeat-containing protein [Catenovulum maritimum]
MSCIKRSIQLAFLATSIYPVSAISATQNIIQVGPEKTYKLPSEAAAIAKEGDVIEIDAAVYSCDAGVKWRASNLTIRGVNGRPHITWKDCSGSIPGGKGIWNTLGYNVTIENIELSYAEVSDHNGAGIRHDGGGNLIIKNSYFHHNENGILVTPITSRYPSVGNNVFITSSEFSYNGYKDGKSHNMYITNTNVFSIINSYSHSVDTGHLIKTIAKNNYIIGNKLSDNTEGKSSYHIDVTGGGPTYISGNLMIQTENSPNYTMIAYAAESREGSRNNPNKKLFVNHNTIINKHPKGQFLKLYDNMSDFQTGVISNNLYYGLSDSNFIIHRNSATKNLLENYNNQVALEEDFENFGLDNYYLTESSAAIDQGQPITNELSSYLAFPTTEFLPGGKIKMRLIDATPDIGAFEYDGAIHETPIISFSADEYSIGYLTDTRLNWEVKNALSCHASGSWEGKIEYNGTINTEKLFRDSQFVITCEGQGGNSTALVNIDVLDSPKVALLPDLSREEIADTQINPYLDRTDPYVSGVNKYWPSNTISTVYVPQNGKVYIAGGGQRSYFGNEIFSFDVSSRSLSLEHERTDIEKLTIFDVGDRNYWDVFNWGNCSGLWTEDNINYVPSSRNLLNSLVYNTTSNSLFVQGGLVGCGSNRETTDGWLYSLDNNNWTLLHDELEEFKGTTTRAIVHDANTDINIITHNQGTYLYDTETKVYKKVGVGLNTPGVNTIVDKENNLAFYIGKGTFRSYSLDGLSMEMDSLKSEGWELVGDLSLVEMERPALTYNTRLNQIVGWNKKDTIYYLEINKEAKTVEILAKPMELLPGSHLLYIEELEGYLHIASSKTNFNLFKEDR